MSTENVQYTCESIKDSLLFGITNIYCSCSNTAGIDYKSSFDGSYPDFEEIERIRQDVINQFIHGEQPQRCVNCYMKKEVSGIEECKKNEEYLTTKITKELKQIYISHWMHCNCGCIYCCNAWKTKLKISPHPKKSDFYDILPMIKQMCSEGYIGKGTIISFLGGEPTMLEEFEPLTELLAQYTEQHFNFLSSGILFSNIIEKMLSQGRASIYISIDSWNKKLYKQIKRVDKFDVVIENSKRYLQACPEDNKQAISLKYIMIRGLNDTQKDIDEFVNLAKEIGIQKITLDVDHRNVGKQNFVIPEHYYDIFYNFKQIKELSAATTVQCDEILNRKTIF